MNININKYIYMYIYLYRVAVFCYSCDGDICFELVDSCFSFLIFFMLVCTRSIIK